VLDGEPGVRKVVKRAWRLEGHDVAFGGPMALKRSPGGSPRPGVVEILDHLDEREDVLNGS
jgi:hypothetical protein